MGSEPVSIYGTADGGRHWALESTSAGAPASWGPATAGALPIGCDKYVGFSATTVGWASFVCASGLSPIYGSTDAGRTWVARKVGTLPAAYSLSPAGGAGQWTSAPIFDGDAGAIGLSLQAKTEASLVYRTSDGGATWSPAVPPGGPRDWSVDVVTASTWKLTLGRAVLTTTDGGRTWGTATSNLGFAGQSHPEYVTAEDGWYTPLSGGTLYRTADGGRLWEQVGLPVFPANDQS